MPKSTIRTYNLCKNSLDLVSEKKESHTSMEECWRNKVVVTDAGGIQGFSGNSYFINGRLALIHRGEGTFAHSSKKNDFSAFNSLKQNFEDNFEILFENQINLIQ